MKVAETFVDLQQARHEADYNTAQRFSRRDVLDLIDQADQAAKDWRGVRNTLPADTFLVGYLSGGIACIREHAPLNAERSSSSSARSTDVSS